jgi:regulator of nonsense transcripts 2
MYFVSVAKRLAKEHKMLTKMKQHNEDYRVTRGELTDQQKSRFEGATKSVDRLKQFCTTLSVAFSWDMPALVEEKATEAFSATVVDPLSNKHSADIDWSQTPWEDEEMYSFYTDLPDLTNMIRASLKVNFYLH